MPNKTGRGKGYLGENIFYEDNGCEYAKKQNYEGTCLPSKNFPDGCPFTILCLEDVHDTECKEKRDEKIREMYNEGVMQTEISRLLGISVATVFQVIHGNTWNNVSRKYEKVINNA